MKHFPSIGSPLSKKELALENPHSPLTLETLAKIVDQVDERDPEMLPFFEEEAAAEIGRIEAILHQWHLKEGHCQREEFLRTLHTLKGAANSIGQIRIGSLAGGMKDSLQAMNEEQMTKLRAEVTKATVTVVEAIKMLLREAHAPKYNRAEKELILKSVQLITDLRTKAAALESPL
jgi:chemotaxis protein histidine kinase CheA